MLRPLIGIPMYSNINKPDRMRLEFTGVSNYTRALDLNGGLGVFVPLTLNEDTLRGVYERLDGLLLSGGVDVHPKAYGEEVAPYCGEIDGLRDDTELKMVSWALQEQKPVLAICRGVQVLNVASGGSLFQDIEAQHPDPIAHRRVSHTLENSPHSIVIEGDSRLAQAVGTTQIVVNSYHHQALKNVGANLRVIARTSDQIVEAVQGTNGRFVLGVQFHPEMMLDEEPRVHGIFRDFVVACRD
ncbi:MAG: gamma-glutamyl-gamma-aminobutyrate hydrolase family protein [Chloroflexi bacterium]|nr:gamma-glutamyl-gamma-aminobutyrate hydrolase family protein [Chloroflexota bacterium]MBI3734149.1 gamma-glutamyl-gamma-aminobutyrate hydrolase family protein [Chloroflexota bacterium]